MVPQASTAVADRADHVSFLLTSVATKRASAPKSSAQRGDRSLARVRVPLGHEHLRSLGGEAPADAQPDAVARRR